MLSARLETPRHVPLVTATRDGFVESVHYGSAVVTSPQGTPLFAAGEPAAPVYPRSSLKPLQAVAMIRAGLVLPTELLALAASSHSGAAAHQDGAAHILARYGLDESALANVPDLPYGVAEREQWLRSGNPPTRLAQNCSGKHAAMAATCVVNGWPVDGYLDPGHPLQRLVKDTVSELVGEEPSATTTDGCGTPLFAYSLTAMARAYGRLAAADAGTAEGTLARAMREHPEMVAGAQRDVTALMRAVPGLLAKDGAEAVQVVGLPDGRGVAVKISDGGDRARMPVTVLILAALGLDRRRVAALGTTPVLGGGRPVGTLRAADSLVDDLALHQTYSDHEERCS